MGFGISCQTQRERRLARRLIREGLYDFYVARINEARMRRKGDKAARKAAAKKKREAEQFREMAKKALAFPVVIVSDDPVFVPSNIYCGLFGVRDALCA